MAARVHRSGLLLVLLLHLSLTIYYSVVIPPWEAHDEWAHYKFVEYVARERELPPPDVRLTHEYEYDEANQPPLYYLIASLPLMLLTPDEGYRLQVNPYFDLGTGAGGVNAAVHDPDAEGFPWSGTVRALHIVRGVSVVIGLLGLIPVYALGRLMAPERPEMALLALCLAAFSPQYVFISSVVTNDVLIIALGLCSAWLGARVVLKGIDARTGIALTAVTGMALVTKLSAVSFLPFVTLALLAGVFRARRAGRSRRYAWLAFSLPLGGALLVVAAWLRRNWLLTGELLPRDPWVMLRLVNRWIKASPDVHPMRLADLPPALVYGFRTFWASFGWGNIEAEGWVYWLLTALTGLGLVGALIWLTGRCRTLAERLAACLLAVLVLSVGGLAAYRDFDYGSQLIRGRYVLPALGAVAVLIALGIVELARRLAPRWSRSVPAMIGGILLAVTLIIPESVILPAYAPPRSLADASLLPGEMPVGARFGDLAELVAYETWPQSVGPGEALGVSLLWRALAPADANYTLAVHLQDADNRLVGESNTYPGRGNYATSLWQTGALFRETLWVTVREPIDRPIMGRVKVAFFLASEEGRLDHLSVTDAQGHEIGDALVIGRTRLDPRRAESVEVGPYLAQFDDAIVLSAAERSDAEAPVVAGEALTVTLRWVARDRPGADYNVFVHLEDAEGTVGFGDGPPDQGRLPTSLWETGDMVEDVHHVQVPQDAADGTYRLLVGLYDTNGRRAGAVSADGISLPEQAVDLGGVTVRRLRAVGFVPLLSAGNETGDE